MFSQADAEAEPIWPLEFQEERWSWRKQIATAIAVAVGFGLLSAGGRMLSESNHHIFTFCAADGVLMVVLLRRPMRYWWMMLAGAWLGDAVSMQVVLGYAPWLIASISLCNVLESWLAAGWMRRALARNRDLASPAIMLRFLLYGIVLAPAATGMLASVCSHLAGGGGLWTIFTHWYPPYALGMALMVPFSLALRDPELKELFSRGRILPTAGVLLGVLLLTAAVFQETRYSLLFLLVPLLMLAVFEVRVVGSALVLFESVLVATLFTLDGRGPFWVGDGATLRSSVLLLQLASLLVVTWMMPFAATLERQRRLREGLHQQMRRYRLLAENSRDIVVLASLEGRRLYVSPAVYDVLGWTQAEWANQDAADFMHRDDLATFRRMLKDLRRGAERRAIRYRTRHKKGEYVWMEANVRTLPDETTGKPSAFVANIRDISERVEAERKLSEAHEYVQQQAQRDSLTQLANRRSFDEALEREWRRGRRTGSPLALLMVDIDSFKDVNDTYGHRAGDQCLQALAAVLRKSGRRPGDLIARYGGEEFAVLLPDTDLAAATGIADMLCLRVRQQTFEAGTGCSLALTVSVGVAAQVPEKRNRADGLVEAADRALYAAKQAGRDCVMAECAAGMAAPMFDPVE